MSKFMCHNCKTSFEKTGSCTGCGSALEKTCPVCKEEIENCVCTGDIVQTKGTGHH